MYMICSACMNVFKYMRYIIVFDCYASAVSYKGFRIIWKNDVACILLLKVDRKTIAGSQ